MRQGRERGAVAVEFALLAPVLIMLVLGIVEFGRAYNAQIALSSAAREGVRVMAISNNPSAARTAAKNAAAALHPGLTDITISPAKCTTGAQVTLKITYTLSTVTRIAGPFPLEGRGVMLCGG